MRPPLLPLPEQLAYLVDPILHPKTPEQAAKVRHEWDVPSHMPAPTEIGASGNPMATNPDLNPKARTTFALWMAMVAEGTTLDYLTATRGLGGVLRASWNAGDTPNSVDISLLPPAARALFPQLRLAAAALTSSASKFPPSSSPSQPSSIFPPTHLTHGTADTSVNHHESKYTHSQLLALGIHTELILLEGRGHMFEMGYIEGGEEWQDVKKAFDSIEMFLKKYLDTHLAGR